MKSKRKALLLMMCAVLLVVASIFGTLAYLTDSEAVKNTFTVGQISMSMDEAPVNEDGIADTTAARVQANEYHLLPGHTYSKDPTIHVDANSEDAYIFIVVDNNGIEAIEETADGYTSVAKQIEANGWIWWNNENNVHYFYQEYTKNVSTTDLVVFEQFKVGDAVTNKQLADFYEGADANNDTAKAVIVTAYAVQQDGFESYEEAWNATFGKTNP